MLASKLTINTRHGGHTIRFDAPGPVTQTVLGESIQAARVLGHLNVALSGHPWSPCRQLIIFNQEPA